VPLERTLVRRDDVQVTLMGAVAYSTGFKIWLQILRRAGDLSAVFQTGFDLLFRESEVTDKFLRLGVEFSDGRRATNLDALTDETRRRANAAPPQIFLDERGQGGNGHVGGLGAWIWPLPPPGPLAIVIEWPAIGLLQTKTEIEAEPIIQAAARSQKLWDNDPVWEDEAE
jgi:hypothetical protein